MTDKNAKFGIGAIVKHRLYPFRGVVVDVDPEFDNTDEWYESIPAELRPDKKLDKECFLYLVRKDRKKFQRVHRLLTANDEIKRVKKIDIPAEEHK